MTDEAAVTQSGKIEFVEFHRPGLEDGDYEIEIAQEVKSEGPSGGGKIRGTTFRAEGRFAVYGERFELTPAQINSMFPPPGSLGEHSHVFPHIILNRSTLPWERAADVHEADPRPPWMALLLFDDDEKLGGTLTKEEFVARYNAANKVGPNGDSLWEHLLDATVGWLKPPAQPNGRAAILANAARKSPALLNEFAGSEAWVETILNQSRTPKIITLGELKASSEDVVKWPGLAIESAQHADDKVTIIDVEATWLRGIIPTWNDLSLLAHVRQAKPGATNSNGNSADGPSDELAVVVGNRLPRKGGVSTAHLVSVESRYDSSTGFDFQNATDGDLIRLVSLKSWSFACVDEKQSFKQLLKHLDRTYSTVRLPSPPGSSAEAERYLATGSVPLPHSLRQGDTTVSWYHGPLSPSESATEVSLPARGADALARYNPVNGMFDVSYAAAWELGRLLAMQSKQFSVGLYKWKRSHALQLKQAEQRLLHCHLPVQGPTVDGQDTPEDIRSWFEDLSLLKGVPFNYLVPDERMLPSESIRFFWLDDLWMDCLLDGAFSVGRVTSSDHDRDRGLMENVARSARNQLTGFLLRSDVVAGWPALLVDAYDSSDAGTGKKLELVRMDRLSTNVLLCLFDGEAKRVEIHQKPEALHLGFATPDDNHAGFWKTLRTDPSQAPSTTSSTPEISEFVKTVSNPQTLQPVETDPVEVPWREEKTRRCLDISALAAAIQRKLALEVPNSATFAFQMIEGVEKVVFLRKAS
jgi:hypothetical protein